MTPPPAPPAGALPAAEARAAPRCTTRRIAGVAIALGTVLSGVVPGSAAQDTVPGPPDPMPRFTDVTARLGVDFVHHHGGTGDKQLPETMGAGVAWLDYDRDGRHDVYFVDSAGPNVLYRGTPGGGFGPVHRAGVDDRGYGMGVSVADFDGDGFPDVYVTNLGANVLYRNNGDGTFTDVTAAAGVGDPSWSVSSAWGDFDGDALPDLYVANYLDFDLDNPLYCGEPERGIRSYCHITLFDGVGDRLYRNDGDGTFTDVAGRVGFTEVGKGLGVTVGHVDDDGRLDVYVANDTTRNFLLLNRGGFAFEDVGLVSGVGYGVDGRPQAGMGTELGDLDGDGAAEILVTNFDAEPVNLYRSVAPGFYLDDSFQLGLGGPTLPTLGFGLALEDFDGDGDLDVAIANGHILDDVARVKDNATYPQPNQVLVNRLTELRDAARAGRPPAAAVAGGNSAAPAPWRPDRDLLTDVTELAGEPMRRARVSRGMAAADLDGDGRPDLAVTNSNGPAELLRNDTAGDNRRLVIRLVGRGSDRDAVGAIVRIRPAGSDIVWTRQVGNASSYASQHSADLYVGLGDRGAASVEITWPGGATETIQLDAGSLYVVAEGRGPVAETPLAR